MSWFSSAVKGVGKVVKNVGHAAGKVLSNPLVDAGLAFIPGVGPVAAGLAAGAGRLIAPGGNIGNALVTGGTTGLTSGLVKGAGSSVLSKIPGVGGFFSGGGAGATDALAGNVAPSAASAVGLPTAAGGGGLLDKVGGLVKSAGQYALKNPGTVLTAAQGVNAALDAAQSRSLENKAMGYATDDYSARAPLRSAGIAGLLAPPVNLSGNRAYSSAGNPYAMEAKPTRRILGVTRRQASS
jgi:hypothetical protein